MHVRRRLQALRAAVTDWWVNPGCPICGRATRDIEGHVRTEHAERPGLSGSR